MTGWHWLVVPDLVVLRGTGLDVSTLDTRVLAVRQNGRPVLSERHP
jgi:hypothetical protein